MRSILLTALVASAAAGCFLPRLDVGDANRDGGTGGSKGGAGQAGAAGLGGARDPGDAGNDVSSDATAGRGGAPGDGGGGDGAGDGRAIDASIDRSADVSIDASNDVTSSGGAGGAAGSSAGGASGTSGVSGSGGAAGGGGRSDSGGGAGGATNDASIDVGAPVDVALDGALDVGSIDVPSDPGCTPNSTPTTCAGNVPQYCDANGSWQNGAACGPDHPTCEKGSCVCNGTVCNDLCVDTNSDGFHCGRCNHNCLGGACTQGRCEATTIASGLVYPHGIAVDAQYVYWTNYGEEQSINVGSIMRANLDGTNVLTLATNQDKPIRLVVTADTLYWSNTGDGRIMKMSLPPSNTPEPMATGLVSGGDLTSFGSSLYFTSYTDPGSVLKQGFSDANPTPLVSGLALPFGVAADAAWIFWTNGDGTVKRSSPQGTGVMDLASGEDEPWEIAADANDVYFTTKTAVRRVPRSGGGAQPFASGQSNPWGIAIDSTGVYWTGHNNDTIMRQLQGTVDSAIVMSGASHPAQIALDAVAIYWTDNTNPGAIRRLAK
jgi:hypothetical protein